MPKTIDLETRNLLPVEEAKARITRGFEQLRARYLDVIGSADMRWDGDTAYVSVHVLTHEVDARIAVTAGDIKLQVRMPWLLAPFAPLVETVIVAQAKATIPIAADEAPPAN